MQISACAAMGLIMLGVMVGLPLILFTAGPLFRWASSLVQRAVLLPNKIRDFIPVPTAARISFAATAAICLLVLGLSAKFVSQAEIEVVPCHPQTAMMEQSSNRMLCSTADNFFVPNS